MTQELYQKALRYASKLIGEYSPAYSDAHDLVHDGWVSCQNEDFLFRGIKNAYYNALRKQYLVVGNDNRNSIKGETIRLYFTEINPTESQYGDGTIDIKSEDDNDHGDTNIFFSSLKEFDQKVLEYKIEGHPTVDIEGLFGTKKVRNSIKRLKEMYTNSPFNGCKVKVTKTMKRKTFEAHPELLEKFEMGDKSDYNEYYTLMTSKESPDEGLLIREEEPKTLFM